MARAIVQPQPFSPERPYLFRPMRVDPSGTSGPTRRAARGRAYRRASSGLYLPASITADLTEQRIVEAAANLPSFGGVTGWAGLHWLGARWLSGRGPDEHAYPVDLATGYADVRNQPGHLVSQERLGPEELTTHEGLPITFAVRSLYYAIRYAAHVRDAVALIDMTAFDDIVALDELGAYALANPGWTGAPQARDAIALADENSWSPQETYTRLRWKLDAGLPDLLTNRPIFDRSGRHLATPDLLDEEAGVVVEYGGAVHLDPAMRRTDIGREELFRTLGLEVVLVTAGMTRESVAARMMAARARALFLSESRRAWTVHAPSWWISTATVRERRALEGERRVRLLAYRRAAG